MKRSPVLTAPVGRRAKCKDIKCRDIRWQGRTLSDPRQHDGAVRGLKSPMLSQYPYRRETGPRLIPKVLSGGRGMEPSRLVRLATARPCSLASRTILFISKQVSHSM